MKKFILIFIFGLLCMSSFAQTYRYRAEEYAIATKNSYGNYSWGDWESCNVVITIDFDRDYIKVYSKREQNYAIISTGDEYTDKWGATNIDCKAIDEEGIECTISIRVQKDGIGQLYAYYTNIAWVYSGLERL